MGLLENLLILFVILVVVFLIVGAYFILSRPVAPVVNPTDFVNTFQPNAFWSTPVPSGNSPQNTCQVYTFPTQRVSGEVLPGAPSLAPDLISRANRGPLLGGCLDGDQVQAQQVIHTCTGATGVTSGDASVWCYRQDGTRATLGETETYYTTSTCSAGPCVGVLGGISLSFQPPGFVKCIRKIGDGPVNTETDCISADEGVFGWRITRVNPGQDPASKPSGQSASGILAQIYARQENACLSPLSNTSGSEVVLQACSATPNNGFNWLFAPSLLPVDSTHPDISPPQIAFVGSFDTATIPTDPTQLRQWLETNNPLSLQYQPGNVTLAPFQFQLTGQGQQVLAQYIDYNILNLIIDIDACCMRTNGTQGPCSVSTEGPCVNL